MSTKKTALTMTDSERCFSESYDPDLPEDFPKSLKDENYMLKIIVEEQKIALDMIMRKYREQTDRLTQLSQIDVRKLHYQRYLNTIVNQMNKMNKMKQTMRKNLLVIFKYEELMREMEAENERLRELVKTLPKPTDKSKNGPELKESLEVYSQTDVLSDLPMEHKAVGSDTPISKRSPQKPNSEPRSSCTEVVPYVSIGYDFGDAGKSSAKVPSPAELPYDKVYELFLSRFASASISGGVNICGGAKTDVTDLELFEDPSETCIPPDFQSKEYDEITSASVKSGHATPTTSKNRTTEEIYDDVQ